MRIENNQPVTTDTLDNEATYFTSALLNACYSVLEHLMTQGKRALQPAGTCEAEALLSKLTSEVRAFRAGNTDVYENSRGMRSLAVHLEVVEAKQLTRQHGGFGTSMFGTAQFGSASTSRHLYVEYPDAGSRLMIVPRMTEHVEELDVLVERWDGKLEAM